jgi:hypothetical protein
VATTRRKKRRRRGGGGKKGGVMMGMRSGFKNLADNVTGSGAREQKKSSVLGTVVTIALVIAAAAFAWYRFG